ncbi:glycosyltransferase [Flavobacterium sp. TP390]|uniref:Glycosyltransferase n=1 Tax=Flavobacterium profundi TaxID=1774945 RepID=A0A6I4IVR3_9FLAO|nr:glycosyltransferase family 4 protein [Flavobacterium profundi]MVO10966.1 glycosyltransferase [Flavobacterium profundi]
MKILHISGAKGWGGNEQQIIYILPKLNALGVQNIVCGLKNSVLEKECEKNNISFIPFRNKKLKSFSNYKQLAKISKVETQDIIQLHTSDSLMFFLLSNFLFRIKGKLVFSKKGVGVSGSFLSKIKYNSSRIDAILCVSKMVEESFGKTLTPKMKDKTIVINDCVSLDILDLKSDIKIRKLYNIPDDKLLVGNIANHTNAKDLFTLIDVLAEIKHVHNRNDIVFVQVGEFSKKTDKLKEYAIKKKVFKDIIFMNQIKNASSLNNQFDVFLLTSQREGGPTSLLEAMLMGTPVVSTKVGVVPDIIQDGSNGFSAEIKDAKKLSKNIIELLDNKKLQKEFSETNMEIVKTKFSAVYIANQIKNEFEKLLKTN